jgi:hypothetical protein
MGKKADQALYMKKMVHLEYKFKDILKSSRQIKFEFNSYFDDETELCKVYVLTDLLLVINEKDLNNEQLVCKMFLDSSSFVEKCDDMEDDERKYMLVTGKDSVGLFGLSKL